MPTLREILNQCSSSQLKSCANVCLLPDSGSKSELVSTLVQGCPPSQILRSLGGNKLKQLCRAHALPVSGNIDTVVERMLDITTMPTKTDTARKKCQMCGHLFDQIALEQHHFIPKSVAEAQWGYIGGVILLCGACHNILHRRQDEEQAKKGSKLVEDEIRKLFKRTKREVQAGKYGRR